MKTDDLFFGPKAKIARARQHITTLEEAEATYIDSQPVERFEEPAENGFTAYKIRATKQPPNYLPAIVADAIGGLRSSLDLAVCACGIAKGATDLKKTYFHFANTEAEWDKLVKGKTKSAPSQTVKVMRTLKPWNGGNNPLYALSKLAAADKHQLLTPMVFNHNRTTISDGVFLGSVVMDRLWDAEKQEGTLYKVGPGGIGVEPRVSLQMFFAFGQVELIPYQPIIAVLNEIASMCEQAVWAIQNSLLDDAQVVMSSIKG